jgi:exportin-2 (importin alpha re-exporter)
LLTVAFRLPLDAGGEGLGSEPPARHANITLSTASRIDPGRRAYPSVCIVRPVAPCRPLPHLRPAMSVPTPALLAAIASAVTATLSPDQVTRRAAEEQLSAARATPSFAPALLALVEAPDAPPHTRQAAAIYLKNHTARFYADAAWRSAASADRQAVKAALVAVMLRVPVLVRRQLSEVLAVIAEHEYPDMWPELVPDLGAKLGALVAAPATVDWLSIQGVLETLHAVFERYPWRERSNPLYSEINYSLSHTQAPLLACFNKISLVLHDAPTVSAMDAKNRELVVQDADLVCKVFFCLSWQEMPPFFEENMNPFMTELNRFLVYENVSIDDGTDHDTPSCIDDLHVTVLEILNLYESKHDEEFRPFLQNFVNVTWQLLTRRLNCAKHDRVVTAGIKFLTTVARSPDYALFSDPATLAQVCQQIVIPNIQLREDDEELFEDNPVEYIRRDMEGSDGDTRRRGAVELVKGLCVHFEQPVTTAFSSNVSQMLAPQSSWRDKDTALFIVTALGWKSGTAAGGVTETSSLIDVLDFYRSQVLPNLTAFASSPSALDTPIFTADIVKYIISFRNQIPKGDYPGVIQLCVKLLGASQPVIQTYAASCIERLLSVREVASAANGNGISSASAPRPPGHGTGNGGGAVLPAARITRIARMNKDDIRPMLPTLLPAIVRVLQLSTRADEYVMRLLLRVVTVAKDDMASYTEQTLAVVLSVLNVVIENPANPLFNHYLFEVVSALIRFVGSPSTVVTFESTLMRPLQTILERDVTEFGPYVFQIYSQLMALHPSELPVSYNALIPPLMEPSMWERRGYIRGMVQYLETFLVKNSATVVANNQLRPILGIFNKLVASKATDHLGIQLVCTIIETYELAVLKGELLNAIVSVLVTRLQAAKTPKYVQNLLYLMSVIVLRYGVDAIVEAMNALQPGLMTMFLTQVWIAEVPSIVRPNDRRICAIAMADLACATDLCCGEPFASQWAPMINATLALTEGVQTDTAGDLSDDEDDAPMGSGDVYSGGHSQLKWAGSESAFSGVGRRGVAVGVDPRVHLAARVSAFTGRHPGVYGPVIAQRVEQGAQAALQAYMTSAGMTMS